MEGVEAARHLRARAPVLVIYLSASTDVRTVARAWQTAPAGYMGKPASDQALRTTIAWALEGPSAAAQGQPT
jgi:DNA-binding NarL/FixJ family response regulator